MGKPNRDSRKTFLGKTVGQPTNDSLSILNEGSLADYTVSLEFQIENEKNPHPKHRTALIIAQQKLREEKSAREMRGW